MNRKTTRTSWSILVFLIVLLVAPGFLPARPLNPPSLPSSFDRDQISPLSSATFGNDTVFFGGTTWAPDSMRWEAIRDSVWTFDTGVGSAIKQPGKSYPGVNPFKQDGFHAYMEGWTGVDHSYSEPIPYFRRLSATDPRWAGTVCVGVPAGLGGDYSFWAGVFESEAVDLCFPGGQGYGNNWYACISHPFAYTGSEVTLEFDYVVDTEHGYDFASVIVDTTGNGNENEAIAYDGQSTGRDSLTLRPGLELPSVPGNIAIRFCFTSDGAWSDQDSLFDSSCGAFAVDNIEISGGVVHFTDFETDDGGWALGATVPGLGVGGDWSRLAALSDLPAIPGSCTIQDSVLVFDVPETNLLNAMFQDNVAVSPWIDLERAGISGMPGRFIELDGYYLLPFYNYRFLLLEAQWFPDTNPCTGQSMASDLTATRLVFHFGDNPYCPPDPNRFDFTGLVPDGIEQARIALGVVSYCQFFSNCTVTEGQSPWFDNVRFGVHTTNSIQSNIDAAAEGDTVRVPPGVYTGPGNYNLDFKGKNLVLKSLGNAANTIINCEARGRGFIFQSGEDSTSIVEGFTIVDAVAVDKADYLDGGGILITNGSSPTIRNCVIRECTAGRGGGIFIDRESSARISSCFILNNVTEKSLSFGGGIGCDGIGVLIEDCTIDGNTAGVDFGLGHGGGIGSWTDVTINRCTISNNSATHGGGVRLAGRGSVNDCTIEKNRARVEGGGIFSATTGQWCGGSAKILNCLISENTAETGWGGGFFGCGNQVKDCIFIQNTAVLGGGASGLDTWFSRCTFLDNQAVERAGGVYLAGGKADSCIITGNQAAEGGGVFTDTWYLASSTTVSNCIISGNEANRGGGAMIGFSGNFNNINMISCTVSGNRSTSYGGGMYVVPSIEITCQTSIFWGNCADSLGNGIYLPDTSSTVIFECSAMDFSGLAGPGQFICEGPQVITDPLFCGPLSSTEAPITGGDYSLTSGSPCLPGGNQCGLLIGALGEGCTVFQIPGVEQSTLAIPPGITPYPNPFSGNLNLSYAGSGDASTELQIFDVTGRLIRSYKPSNSVGTLVWDGKDNSGRRTSPGVYFIRFRSGSVNQTKRIVRLQ